MCTTNADEVLGLKENFLACFIPQQFLDLWYLSTHFLLKKCSISITYESKYKNRYHKKFVGTTLVNNVHAFQFGDLDFHNLTTTAI